MLIFSGKFFAGFRDRIDPLLKFAAIEIAENYISQTNLLSSGYFAVTIIGIVARTDKDEFFDPATGQQIIEFPLIVGVVAMVGKSQRAIGKVEIHALEFPQPFHNAA